MGEKGGSAVASLYEQLEAKNKGGMALASARLRYEVLGALHKALDACGMSQSDLARRMQLRRSAVNQVFRGDGNVRISTLAEYLYSMGYELDLQLVGAGEPRRAELEDRRPEPAFPVSNTTADSLTSWVANWKLKLPKPEVEGVFHVFFPSTMPHALAQYEMPSRQMNWFFAGGNPHLDMLTEHEDTSTGSSVSRIAS
jgi:transcriptional regulator with XRE-family HTH domain